MCGVVPGTVALAQEVDSEETAVRVQNPPGHRGESVTRPPAISIWFTWLGPLPLGQL